MNDDEARVKYDRRSEETRTIKRIDPDGTVHTDLWSYGGDAARTLITAGVRPGDVVIFETVLGSQVTGARLPGPGDRWLWRRSTDDLIAEHRAMVEGFRRREREQLDANRADWERREAALPGWLRARLATFRERGGEGFELGGWGYELTICEIAVILGEHGLDPDGPEVMAYAREHGTSGNQHGMALALARMHEQDASASAAGTVSALSPLTGDAFYDGEEDA
jgi:hypothetical protein